MQDSEWSDTPYHNNRYGGASRGEAWVCRGCRQICATKPQVLAHYHREQCNYSWRPLLLKVDHRGRPVAGQVDSNIVYSDQVAPRHV